MSIEGYQSYERVKLARKENERMAAENELEKQLDKTESGQALLEFQKTLKNIKDNRLQRQKDAVGGIQDSFARLGELEKLRAVEESF